MEANPPPSDYENGLNTQQATDVQNAQPSDNTNGQSPMPTPGAAQACGHKCKLMWYIYHIEATCRLHQCMQEDRPALAEEFGKTASVRTKPVVPPALFTIALTLSA